MMDHIDIINKKWNELLECAQEHATGKGLHKGEPWVRDAFNEFFELHEAEVEAGRTMSFGGLSGSSHNRDVLAEKIYLELRGELTEGEGSRLRNTLRGIAQDPEQIRGLRR